MFKVVRNMAPAFMEQVFAKNLNALTEDVSANTRLKHVFYNPVNTKTVNYGLETLRSLGPKIWSTVPIELKNISSLPLFKTKIKKWIPLNCLCRLCKEFIPQLGYV